MAMLLITHDMGIVAEVADDVAVMRFGRIVERGPVDAIYHAAEHPYTRQLLASTIKLTHHVEGRLPAVALSPEAPQRILSVRNLGKIYGWHGKSNTLRAVDDASFDLYPGENLGIVGESGSGKTTLGRLILRTVEPTSGSISYRGKDGSEIDVTKLTKRELRTFHREVRLVFRTLSPRSIRA